MKKIVLESIVENEKSGLRDLDSVQISSGGMKPSFEYG